MILLVMMLAVVSCEVSAGGGSLPEGAIARLGTLRFNHGSDLSGVAFTQDGRCLVSMGRQGGVRIWETASAREMFTVGGGHVHTVSFAVASDGKSLMTFDEDGLFHRWDLATGRELHHWKLPGKPVFFNCMATSPDGRTLALAGLNNKAASLWNLETLGRSRQLVGDERGIWDVAFSRDGRMVATAAMDGIPRDFATTGAVDREKDRERGSVRLWDVSKGTETQRFPIVDCHPRCVTFSPDSAMLAAGCSDATIRLYDPAAGKEIARFEVKGPMQGVLTFSPDGRVLASGTYPHRTVGSELARVYLWDIVSKKELRAFPSHDQSVTGLAFSPNGKTLATCGSDVAVRLWDTATGNEINPSSAYRSGITCLVVSPTDGSVITGGYDGTIRRWDCMTGRELGRIGPLPRPVHDLAIAPDGRLLLSASLGGDGSLRLWEIATGREVHRLIEGRRGRRVAGLAFAPDGRIATADGKIWEVATGREIAPLRDDQGKGFSPFLACSVVFTPNGQCLISTTSRGGLRVWSADTGRDVGTIGKPDLAVQSIAVSPDGRFVAGAVETDRTIRLWHIASRREVMQLRGQEDQSHALAFSPDGRLLAAGSGDYTRSQDQSVRVWELASGREVRRFQWHRAGVTGVAFLADSRRLVSCSADATAIVWDIASTGQAKAPAPLDLDRRWADLAGNDGAQAQRAIWALVAIPDSVVPFLAERLKPLGADDPAKDTSLGPIASGETLLRLRSISVLEKIGTPEARRVLELVASGLEGARETRHARAAIRRLK